MIEIRIHGLGGQGVVTAAEILALAGWQFGFWTQAMPSFGPERTGAPVSASLRFADAPVLTRAPIARPDWLILTTDKALSNPDTLAGIDRRAKLLINSSANSATLSAKIAKLKAKIYTLDAKKIADDLASPLAANSALLGGWAAVSGLIDLESLQSAIAEKFSDKKNELIQINQQAAKEGYRQLYAQTR
ncbi:MAG: 2-oxoacid:acceptor oxidoreductase family protein [Candidatus Falkowbacteria bacterium]